MYDFSPDTFWIAVSSGVLGTVVSSPLVCCRIDLQIQACDLRGSRWNFPCSLRHFRYFLTMAAAAAMEAEHFPGGDDAGMVGGLHRALDARAEQVVATEICSERVENAGGVGALHHLAW